MQRTHVFALAVVLAISALLWLVPAAVRQEAADEAVPSLVAAETDAAAAGQAAGHGPSLEAGALPPPAPAGEGAAGETEAPPPHGPFLFVVRAIDSELPVAGVELRTLPEPPEPETLLGVTDADGEVQVEWPHAPKLLFRADKAGFVRHRGLASADTPTEIWLFAGIEIRGRVVRGEGSEPVESATVHVFDEDHRAEIAAPVTDALGRFLIPAVRPNHPVTLVTAAPGLVPTVRRENFEVPVQDLEIRVGGGSALLVRVRTAKNRPADDLPVTLDVHPDALPGLRRPAPGQAPFTELRTALSLTLPTDEEGRCRFEGIPKDVGVVPSVRVTERLVVSGRGTRIARDGLDLEEEIRLPMPASLAVRLVDDVGEPVSAAELELRGARGELPVRPADRRGVGRWLFEDLASGTYAVQARLRAAPAQRAEVGLRPALLEELVLVIARGRSLKGRVEDKRRDPVWLGEVLWRATEGRESASTSTDSKGRFELRRLTAATGTLVVRARDVPTHSFGYENESLEGVTPGTEDLLVVLRDATRVTGRFEDLPAEAIVTATMIPGSARDHARLWLDDQQRFARRGPPAGGGALFVFRTDHLPPVLVEAKEPFDDEEVRDLGSLFFEDQNPRLGRVLGLAGRPLRGARVDIDEPWSSRYVRTDAQGDFVFGRLPDQPVQLRVTAEDYLEQRVALDPRSQFQRLTIQLTPAGRLEGTVTDAGRTLVDGAPVALFAVQGRGTQRTLAAHLELVAAQGVFTADLAPGTYVLRAAEQQGEKARQWAEEDVTIRIGQTTQLKVRLRYGQAPWAKR